MSMITIPVEPPITEYLHAKASALHIPLSGTFELTPVCNMNCRMCYVRMSEAEQKAIHPLCTVDQWLALAAEAKKQGLLYLLLTGGEPFIRKDFRDLLTGLHKMGFIITINSNGTLIDEKVIEWLKETPPVRINITLYGASNETYNDLCRNPNGFTQVTRGIQMLREAGISVKINCSLTPQNAHDLEGIFEYCKKESLIVQATSYMFPPMRRDACAVGRNDRFTPEEAAYYSAKIEMLMNGPDAFLERRKTKNTAGLSTDPGDDCSPTEGEGIRCRAGKCSFWVTWDGRLLPCGMMIQENVPSVFDIGFTEAWNRASAFACSIRLPAACSRCAIKDQCKACAAMVYTESGNFHTVPDYRCRMAFAYEAACQKIEAEILAGKYKK